MPYGNIGYQNWKIIEQYYADDATPTGQIMPNIAMISPDAIISGAINFITYNYPTDVMPTGGVDGDIWYNPVSDNLYKRLLGVWTILTNRVNNNFYIAPVTSTSCQ